MQRFQKLTPCLWFDDQAEAAAKFYCSIFDHSKITTLTHYSKVGQEVKQGDRMGIIRFGSRVDVFFPVTSRVQVKVGQTTIAGTTIIAELPAK